MDDAQHVRGVSVSPETSTPVDILLREITRLRADNKRLRRRGYWLAASRERWHRRALRRGL